MHLLNTLPQRLDPGATPTFAGLIATSLTSPASTNLTLAAGGTNQNVVLTPSGTGGVGIGTTTPQSKLHIIQANDTDASYGFTIQRTTNESQLWQGYNTGSDVWQITATLGLSGAYKPLTFWTSSTERVRIKSDGDVTISSTTAGAANAGALVLQGGISAGNTGSAASYFGGAVTVSGTTGQNIFVALGTDNNGDALAQIKSTGSTGSSQLGFSDTAAVSGKLLYRHANDSLAIETGGAERARFTSTGLEVTGALSTTGAATFAGAVTALDAAASTGPAAFFRTQNNTTYTSSVLSIQGDRTTTNGSYNLINAINADLSGIFRVLDSGNAVNTNNSYGAASDRKLKENIVDATAKLQKLNQVRIVNFNRIGNGQKQIGVIAQELEQIFPSMIEVAIDRDAEGNDLGTTTKSVKYSVFVPMLIKAVQELTARLAALEAK